MVKAALGAALSLSKSKFVDNSAAPHEAGAAPAPYENPVLEVQAVDCENKYEVTNDTYLSVDDTEFSANSSILETQGVQHKSHIFIDNPSQYIVCTYDGCRGTECQASELSQLTKKTPTSPYLTREEGWFEDIQQVLYLYKEALNFQS